jgi:hypothetical protein
VVRSASAVAEYYDPLPAVTAETAMTMMGGSSPFAVRSAADMFGNRLALTTDHAAVPLATAGPMEVKSLDSRSARL